ncbi:MAG: hypothetical protein ACLUEK_14955 [Oscillospiraceae bacterium]
MNPSGDAGRRVVFHESMSLLAALGVVLVLSAVVLRDLRARPRV